MIKRILMLPIILALILSVPALAESKLKIESLSVHANSDVSASAKIHNLGKKQEIKITVMIPERGLRAASKNIVKGRDTVSAHMISEKIRDGDYVKNSALKHGTCGVIKNPEDF